MTAQTDQAALISEVIGLAWDDRTPFETIAQMTGFTEKEVILIMRQNLKPSSFRLWRKRVCGRKSKHAALMPTHKNVHR